MQGRGIRAVVAAAVVCACLTGSVPATAATREPVAAKSTWKSFMAERTTLLEKLAPAFVGCFRRRDSLIDPLSPIFHGCLDWHSAVHAAYSHHVLYERTDKKEYFDLVQEQVAPLGVSLVPAEEVYEQAKAPDYPLSENPYGFGWFLILARERELSTEKDDFRDMADFAADQLMSWFEARAEAEDADRYILNKAHPNYSWSLLNLDVWGRYTGDETIQAAVREASKPLFDPDLDLLCPVTNDQSPKATGFQPACLMRLAAVAHIWGDHVDRWIEARVPKDYYVPPVTDPANCHAGGLNFTRSFALYQLYLATGNTRLRDNYVELIRYHVGRPELYMGELYVVEPAYDCFSHWVAQVGVRAISLSYEERPSTPIEDAPLD